MTVHANQKTGLTKGRAANWVLEVVFSPFRASFDVPVLLLNQPIIY